MGKQSEWNDNKFPGGVSDAFFNRDEEPNGDTLAFPPESSHVSVAT